MKLTIEATEMTWTPQYESFDLYVHGGVTIRERSTLLLDAAHEFFSLTATAIYLLRTTSKDWPSIHANNNELVPYCGSTFLVSKDGSINSMGCLNDEEIRVRNRKTEIDLKVGEHRRVLDASQWAHGVLGFSQQVRAFYEEVKTADPHPRNTELWNAFELEWTERTLEAEAVTSP